MGAQLEGLLCPTAKLVLAGIKPKLETELNPAAVLAKVKSGNSLALMIGVPAVAATTEAEAVLLLLALTAVAIEADHRARARVAGTVLSAVVRAA